MSEQSLPASVHIDERIRELADWRGEVLAMIRGWILEALPDVTEEWKWRGVPVWNLNGILCTGESYKAAVKITFPDGAKIQDEKGLFNAGLEGNARRAIDIHEGDKIDKEAFVDLIHQAVAIHGSKKKK